ncbi:MAG: DUF1349 domain-containing protein [Planctomycetia bacterium]|nr:DUF1349 domain-containing protein [Planctomycetia bacterium]
MLRTAKVSVLLVVATMLGVLAVAAPAPPPSEKELLARYWGKAVSASDKYEFSLVGKQLVIRTAGEPARGLKFKAKANMPHVTRTLKGDFVATVKVLDATAPNRNVKHEEVKSSTRAGLFVSGGNYNLELHLHQYHTKVNKVLEEKMTRCVWVDAWLNAAGVGNKLKDVEPGKSTYLRVIRQGKGATVTYSFDGKVWAAPFKPKRVLNFPDQVTVGVFLSHTTYQIADATFDDFTIESPPPKPK